MVEKQGRQLSTAVSDFCLGISSFCAAALIWPANPVASLGIGIQSIAALVGVVRFSMTKADDLVITMHKMMSWLATVVGIPALAMGFYLRFSVPQFMYITMGFSIIGICSSTVLDPPSNTLVAEAISGFSILTIIILCFYYSEMSGLAGCMVYVLAGAIIKAEGHWLGIPRVDILHYTLIPGNVAFTIALW